MTISVLALTRYDRMGASSRVRFLQYVPYLERMGLRVEVQPLLPREYLTCLYAHGTRSSVTVAASLINRLLRVLRKGDVDVIWLQREVLPFLPFVLEKILLSGKPIVVDFDDAHHLYYKNAGSYLIRGAFAGKIEALMRHAAAVIVGNPTLEQYARNSGADSVTLIPSAVDVTRLKTAVRAPKTFTVGWIGTPVTATQSLPLIRKPLEKFLAETGSRFLLCGADDAAQDIMADRLPWSESGEVDFFSEVTVGICPLQDTEWNQGKSGYKIIQYMAAGKPALVSPVGIANDLVTQGGTGFHCNTADEWYGSLMQLQQDPALCASMGARAQSQAQEKYDTEIAANCLHKVFEGCMGGQR
ncbi:MAG: glycosyltransferase family 1 protein [Rhodospirillaceae bacterium]|nr:glycosyltransferase family 1 protein [Rhodospirillaceae bacterium]